jgi:hypothetical protein
VLFVDLTLFYLGSFLLFCLVSFVLPIFSTSFLNDLFCIFLLKFLSYLLLVNLCLLIFIADRIFFSLFFW